MVADGFGTNVQSPDFLVFSFVLIIGRRGHDGDVHGDLQYRWRLQLRLRTVGGRLMDDILPYAEVSKPFR